MPATRPVTIKAFITFSYDAVVEKAEPRPDAEDRWQAHGALLDS